jgi:hypothetical protein
MNTDEFSAVGTQTVRTRVAALHTALSFLSLITDKPAAVTVDEVLAVAEHLEHWLWRDYGTPAHVPAPAAPSLASPPPARREGALSPGQGRPRGPEGTASEKQIAAIFAIGKAKGYSPMQIKTWVKGQFNKGVEALSSQEASTLITHLTAA